MHPRRLGRPRRPPARRAGAAALAAILLAVPAACGGGGDDDDDDASAGGTTSTAPTLPTSATAGSCTFDRETDPGNRHIGNPRYKVNPPAGGEHLPLTAPPARYTAERSPADGNLVHSMEHGYIVLWHTPDLTASDEAAIQSVFDRFRRDTMTVPRRPLPGKVVATAWHARLICQEVETEPLATFIATFVNQGPEKVKH